MKVSQVDTSISENQIRSINILLVISLCKSLKNLIIYRLFDHIPLFPKAAIAEA